MPSKGAFQQIKFGAQQGNFGANVIFDQLTGKNGFMCQGVACVGVFNDKRLNAVGKPLNWQPKTNEPTRCATGSLSCLDSLGFAKQFVAVPQKKTRRCRSLGRQKASQTPSASRIRVSVISDNPISSNLGPRTTT